MQPAAYLTVREAAGELGISPDGVYKLISRGHLKAVRKTSRTLRISRLALDAYQRRFVEENPAVPPELTAADVSTVRKEFENQVGMAPDEWERRWKAGEIEDTAENMGHTIRALALVLAEKPEPAGRESEIPVAALERLDGVVGLLQSRQASRVWRAKSATSGRVVSRKTGGTRGSKPRKKE